MFLCTDSCQMAKEVEDGPWFASCRSDNSQVEAARQQLGAIRFTGETASEVLFAQEELNQLLEPLREENLITEEE